MKWITATDLELWAERKDSEGKLSELLRRLITVSVDRIENIHFPSGESTNMPGWDGYLLCKDGAPPFVPDGTSVWEHSTEKDVAGKAFDDFNKRSGPIGRPLPSGFDYASTTYVAVTLRRWHEPKKKKENSRDGFIKHGRSINKWSDIKVIDADDLEHWLELCPSVAAWLALTERVGEIPSTVQSVDEAWHYWRHLSEPPLTEDLLLVDREKEATTLLESLVQASKYIHIKADSLNEAQAFVIAAVQSLPHEDSRRNFILSRAIVIKDEQTALQLPKGEGKRLIIIARDNAKMSAGGLAANGHTVIVPLGNADQGKPPDIVLRRPSRTSFAKGLQSLGIDPAQTELLARQCGCSVTVFQRRKPSSIPQLPSWATKEHLRLLIPALLAGGWTERSDADKTILSSLSEKTYDKYAEVLHELLSVDEPPIAHAGDVWSLAAPADAFTLSEHLITPQDLARLEKSVVDVFSEIDPGLDLEASERPFASLHGKTLKHSSWLRHGLSQTLLLVAVIGNRLTFPHGMDQQIFVNRLIQQLPGLKSNPRLLVSLRDQLPVLVEAAPDPFVEAMETLLQGDDRIAQIIFTDKDSSLFGDCRHAGILWALEVLAWDSEWLPRICLILARLAEIDPGGTYSNRPIRSLREIFLPWHPGTNATHKQRLQAIDLVIRRFPSVGWQLLSSLFPSFHDISHPTQEPIWRESGLSQREVVTRQVAFETYDGVITRALDLVDHDLDRWKTIIDNLSNFSPDYRTKVYELLESICTTELSDRTKAVLWNLLRDHVNKHLAFRDAQWALPEAELVRAEKLMSSLEPSDARQKYKWLFDEHFPDLPMRKSDHDAFSSELNTLRSRAVGEIIQQSGISELLQFIETIAFPGMIAGPVIEYSTDINQLLDIIESSMEHGQSNKVFAKCLSSQALEKYGEEWGNRLLSHAALKKWNDETIATLLLDWPDDMETFRKIASLGESVDRLYWSHRFAWIRNKSHDICTFAVEKLISVGRALDAIGLSDDCSKELESALLLKILDKALLEIDSSSRSLQGLDYHIEQILSTLKIRNDISRTEVARREYSYLPLLVHYGERKDLVLHEILASDPSFFVEVLCDVYKPASGKPEENLDENRRLRAEYGYKLLDSWQVLPGASAGGALDAGILINWVRKVRELASKKDRADIADQEIGKLLAYAPIDPEDGAWPHKAVRELLEELANSEIERGISIEQFNKRGVVSKAMFEGGKQERDLSEQWRQWSATVGSRWHRTFSLLREISDSWERYARQEDERAEQDRLKYR
jgi:hypothetical protein